MKSRSGLKSKSVQTDKRKTLLIPAGQSSSRNEWEKLENIDDKRGNPKYKPCTTHNFKTWSC